MLLWFNEPIDELVRRLQTLSVESLLSNIKSIPAHRHPVYDRVSHQKTSNSLVDHMLRRVSHLFSLGHSPLYETALALCCSLDSELELSPEDLIESIIRHEYTDVLTGAVSSSMPARSECLKLERRNEK